MKVLRLEASCPQIKCLPWLTSQASEKKIYWSDRDATFEMAGIGAADIVRSDEFIDYRKPFLTIREKLSSANDNLRYYGGINFYPPQMKRAKRKYDEEWRLYGAYYFLLPQFEIVRKKEKTFFACNILTRNITEAGIKEYLIALDRLSFLPESPYKKAVPRIRSVHTFPDKSKWFKLFKEHIQPSGKMAYQKIVLAQKTSIELIAELSPLVVFRKLVQKTAGSFHYYFQPQAGRAFFGASPERLFKRQGRSIESEALAGTMPRGRTKEEDVCFEKKLLSSTKDALEHKIVAEAIKKSFHTLCLSFQADDRPAVVKASSGQHLITRFQGRLKKEIGDTHILSGLHPTPAVGGISRQKAVKAIIGFEPFDRGWYAGPIGHIGQTSVDFAVALRCALMHGRKVNLYAGAGIVEGSSAEEELQEIEDKKSIFLKIFSRQKKL